MSLLVQKFAPFPLKKRKFLCSSQRSPELKVGMKGTYVFFKSLRHQTALVQDSCCHYLDSLIGDRGVPSLEDLADDREDDEDDDDAPESA